MIWTGWGRRPSQNWTGHHKTYITEWWVAFKRAVETRVGIMSLVRGLTVPHFIIIILLGQKKYPLKDKCTSFYRLWSHPILVLTRLPTSSWEEEMLRCTCIHRWGLLAVRWWKRWWQVRWSVESYARHVAALRSCAEGDGAGAGTVPCMLIRWWERRGVGVASLPWPACAARPAGLTPSLPPCLR
jgi:hypothetical protein